MGILYQLYYKKGHFNMTRFPDSVVKINSVLPRFFLDPFLRYLTTIKIELVQISLAKDTSS